MLTGRDIVCISGVRWDAYRLSLHQYMRLLARRNRVLFVERPPALARLLRAPRRLLDPAALRGTVRRVDGGLHVATPPPAAPLRFERPVAAVNQLVRGAWARAAAARLGFDAPLLWIHDPDAAGVVGRVGESFSLYWVTDDHPTGPTFRANRANRVSAMRAREHELLRAVDLVLCTAPSLRDLKGPYNANTHVVPHGVDAAHYGRALEADLSVPDAIAGLPQPVVGMVGQLNGRIDTRLVADVARLRPDWSLVLVGPVLGTFDASPLEGLRNVHLPGPRPLEDLPAVLKGMAVCLIPFVIDEHTRAMQPLKTLEYLAAGRPVVSTPLVALRDYAPYVVRAADAGTFVDAVEGELDRDSSARAAERHRFAEAYSWERRLDEIARLVAGTTPGR